MRTELRNEVHRNNESKTTTFNGPNAEGSFCSTGDENRCKQMILSERFRCERFRRESNRRTSDFLITIHGKSFYMPHVVISSAVGLTARCNGSHSLSVGMFRRHSSKRTPTWCFERHKTSCSRTQHS